MHVPRSWKDLPQSDIRRDNIGEQKGGSDCTYTIDRADRTEEKAAVLPFFMVNTHHNAFIYPAHKAENYKINKIPRNFHIRIL